MSQDFNKIINREGTNCYKYELRNKLFNSDDVYPMWVADTEFKAPDFILEALQERLNHGIFGYTLTDDAYYLAIMKWLKNVHAWDTKKEWIKYSPGVVPSVFASVLAFTKPNDKVIIQTPVYFPFYSAVNETGRQLVKNPLILKNGRYQMDLDDLKSKIDNDTKMIILCSPHNPTGNVWKHNELLELCNLCLENDILIVSDEIHADIIYKGNTHIPTATLSGEIADNCITLMAPSKTFNIAGLNSSYIVSSNEGHLKKFHEQIEALHIGPNIFALEATKAAYNNGEQWIKELVKHYTENTDIVRQYISSELRDVSLIEPEGTFLLWLDFRKLGLKRAELNKILVEKAKVGLSDGYMFGPDGEGFQRMNIGCSQIKLTEALNNIGQAFSNI